MRKLNVTLSAGLAIVLSSPVSIAQDVAKRKTATAQRSVVSRTEALRVINGQIRGRTVSGQVDRGARQTNFAFTFTKAEILNRRLQLTGDFTLEGDAARLSDRVSAIFAGSMATAANPWPNAREERKDAKKSKEEEKKAGEQRQGREAKDPEAASKLGQSAQSTQDTVRNTPSAVGEKTEQTQSLYAQSETATGCGVIFLRLMLPQRLRARMGVVAQPLQLGVVLKPFDNDRGEEIVNKICRLAQRVDTRGQSASPDQLDQLNRLLSSK
jgi:hypothetical protein